MLMAFSHAKGVIVFHKLWQFQSSLYKCLPNECVRFELCIQDEGTVPWREANRLSIKRVASETTFYCISLHPRSHLWNASKWRLETPTCQSSCSEWNDWSQNAWRKQKIYPHSLFLNLSHSRLHIFPLKWKESPSLKQSWWWSEHVSHTHVPL